MCHRQRHRHRQSTTMPRSKANNKCVQGVSCSVTVTTKPAAAAPISAISNVNVGGSSTKHKQKKGKRESLSLVYDYTKARQDCGPSTMSSTAGTSATTMEPTTSTTAAAGFCSCPHCEATADDGASTGADKQTRCDADGDSPIGSGTVKPSTSKPTKKGPKGESDTTSAESNSSNVSLCFKMEHCDDDYKLADELFEASRFSSLKPLIYNLSCMTGYNLYQIIVFSEKTREIVDYYTNVLGRLSPYRDHLLESDIQVNQACMMWCTEFKLFDKLSADLLECFTKTDVMFTKGTVKKVGSRRLRNRKKYAFETPMVNHEIGLSLMKKTQDVIWNWIYKSKHLELICKYLYGCLGPLCRMAESLEKCLPVDRRVLLDPGDIGVGGSDIAEIIDALIADPQFGLQHVPSPTNILKDSTSTDKFNKIKSPQPHCASQSVLKNRQTTTESSTTGKKLVGSTTCPDVDKIKNSKSNVKVNKPTDSKQAKAPGTSGHNESEVSSRKENEEKLKGGTKAKQHKAQFSNNSGNFQKCSPRIAATATVTTCRKTGFKAVEVFASSEDGALLESDILSGLVPFSKHLKKNGKRLSFVDKKKLKYKRRTSVDIDYECFETIIDYESDEDYESEFGNVVFNGSTSKDKVMSGELLTSTFTEAACNNNNPIQAASTKPGSKAVKEYTKANCQIGSSGDTNISASTMPKGFCDYKETVENGLMLDVGCQTDFPYGPGDFVLLDDTKPLVEVGELIILNEHGELDFVPVSEEIGEISVYIDSCML